MMDGMGSGGWNAVRFCVHDNKEPLDIWASVPSVCV